MTDITLLVEESQVIVDNKSSYIGIEPVPSNDIDSTKNTDQKKITTLPITLDPTITPYPPIQCEEPILYSKFKCGKNPSNPVQGVHLRPSDYQHSRQSQLETIEGEIPKFISCGHCRVWFVAPTKAHYAACPDCKSVNNCRTDTDQGTSFSKKPFFSS